MPKTERRFLLSELPDYAYSMNLACPECYRPLDSLKRSDGRCDKCLHSKTVLPVNYVREKKRDEDDEDRKVRRYDDRDFAD